MRTIRLREHKTDVARLTDSEVQELLALPDGFVEVTPRGGDEYALRPGSRVGTAVRGSLRVLVRPKVGLRNVLFLLGYANGIRWGHEDFPYGEDDLLRAVAWWFEREVAEAARYGVARAYVDREEALTTIRGRIAVDSQLAIRPGRAYPIECRFQEYSDDTDLNRVLAAAHAALLRVPQLHHDVAQRLRHRARHFFGNVNSVQYSPATLPALHFSRLDRHWETAARVGQIILRQRSIRDDEGAVLGATFTIDMNRVFERFIEAVVTERTRVTPFILEAQARRHLTSPAVAPGGVGVPAINMRPDFLLRNGRVPVAVGDAKYKELLRIGDWEHPDIYQLIAYCTRLQLDRGLLIYAGSRPLTESPVVGSRIKLSTIGVDLTGCPESILQHTRAAADVLISDAAVQAQSRSASTAA